MDHIHITDVAPRDGLQNQAIHLSTDDKLELIRLLVDAGVISVEATSFVSPRAVPKMADASDLMIRLAQVHPGLRVSALVPNLKGLERAAAAGAREIAIVLSATETMNQKNINMGLEQAIETSGQTIRAAKALGMRTRGYLAVAFECPFEGETPLTQLLSVAQQLQAFGPDELVIADTVGAAAPGQVRERLKALKDVLPVENIGAHFHDTRGMGVANAWAALEAGVRRFDASVGGIGGCPFAPGAAGNLATEDLVLMATQSGFSTGVELEALLPVIQFAEEKLQRPLGGRCITWLRRHRRQVVAGQQPREADHISMGQGLEP